MILKTIAESNKIRYNEIQRTVPVEILKEKAETMNRDTGFPFERTLKKDGISYICEVKKASPSKGIIAEDFPYLQIAEEYEEAGASAISVLTEPKWFLGSDSYLSAIAETVIVPVLRKDFTVTPYQIYEAKLLGASAVLLICSITDPDTLACWIELCHSLGLSALVEAHDSSEVKAALDAGARIIGVNNRNLKDFSVNTANCLSLRELVPDDRIFVAESGIKTAADIDLLKRAGVDAVLIGETLMRAPNKAQKLTELNGGFVK